MGIFGGSTTEWGYRTNKRVEVWCSSKGEANRKIRRINNKTSRTGESAKLIQRTVKNTAIKSRPKDTCAGGKCTKRGNICKKHFKAKTGDRMEGKEWTLDGIHARWDEEGHRWG